MMMPAATDTQPSTPTGPPWPARTYRFRPGAARQSKTPTGPAQARIAWLTDHGATLRGIARASTVPYPVVQSIASGRTRHTSPAIADRILAVTPDQARPPVNRGGPGRSAYRIDADDLDVYATRGDDVPTAAARFGVKTWSLRAWCSRSSPAVPADVRRALLARLERNAAERGQRVA